MKSDRWYCGDSWIANSGICVDNKYHVVVITDNNIYVDKKKVLWIEAIPYLQELFWDNEND